MHARQIHDYLNTFFYETNCKKVDETDHSLTVQLTVDIDKRIMNRPFYWSYIESTNGEPNPMQLTLITDRSKINGIIQQGEVIHFGSARLKSIFQATKELGSIVRMYEQTNATLFPWLGINYKVSYQCDRTKETMYSLGVNLINGTIVSEFQETLKQKQLQEQPPSNAFALDFIIKPLRGLERLDGVIENFIQEDDHQWAVDAQKRRNRELEILNYFYEDEEEKPESYYIEKQAIEDRFNPRLNVEIINGGLFYLK